jgi:DNA replication and repair protein RecF
MEVLKKEKGFSPSCSICLKNYEERISSLLQKVCTENEGQIFITDTNEERLKSFTQLKLPPKYWGCDI